MPPRVSGSTHSASGSLWDIGPIFDILLAKAFLNYNSFFTSYRLNYILIYHQRSQFKTEITYTTVTKIYNQPLFNIIFLNWTKASTYFLWYLNIYGINLLNNKFKRYFELSPSQRGKLWNSDPSAHRLRSRTDKRADTISDSTDPCSYQVSNQTVKSTFHY